MRFVKTTAPRSSREELVMHWSLFQQMKFLSGDQSTAVWKLFPTCISIPKKLKDKFWKKETQLFGNGKATRIFCSLKIIIALQKRRHLLYI